MKTKFHTAGKVILCVCLALIALFYFLHALNGVIGIPADKLEHDLHTVSHVPEDWTVTGHTSDTVAAFISYPEDRSDYTCDLYVKRDGFSFGYFFRGGGSLCRFEEPVSGYIVEGYQECAYFSLNEHHIAKVTVYTGTSRRVFELDKDRPFAIVLPTDQGIVTFYDAQGEEVEHFVWPI